MRHGLYRTMSARCETLHNINHAQAGDLPVGVTRLHQQTVDEHNDHLNLGGDTHGPVCACICGTAPAAIGCPLEHQ
jgi:hypothetical protein